jgi:branched-chain amino acid transport system permease protein
VLPVTLAVGGLIALVFGAFLFLGQRRFNSIFVAMSALVLAYISERTANAWPAVGSATGIPNVPLMSIVPWSVTALPLGNASYYVVAALLAVVYMGLRLLIGSQFGLVLASVRDESTAERASSLGYDTVRFRLFLYVLSGCIAGVAGGLYSFHEGYVSPDLLGVTFSTQVILWVLIGGRGTLIGALTGALVMNYVSLQLSGTFLVVWQIILGLLLVLIITLLPHGLTGLLIRSSTTDFGKYRGSAFVRSAPDRVSP